MKTQQTKAPQKNCHDDSKLPTCYRWNSNPNSLSLSRITIILISIILSGTMIGCASKEERLIDALNSKRCIKAGELIREGANINTNTIGQRALLLSIELCPDLVPEIIDKGADVNIKNGEGKTPLMIALSRGDIETTKVLLDKGADVNIKNGDGKTPLMIALSRGDIETTKVLLDKGAETGMHLNKGSSVEVLQDNQGNITLHYAIDAIKYIKNIENLKIVKELLEESKVPEMMPVLQWLWRFEICDLKTPNSQGQTPLHLAIETLTFDEFDQLLDTLNEMCYSERFSFDTVSYDVLPFIQDEDGNTILHIAAKRGSKFGRLIYSWVKSRSHYLDNDTAFNPEILEALVRIQNKQGNTAKHLCYTHSDPEYCKYFDINLSAEKIKNNEGLAPRGIYEIREKEIAEREKCHISSWKLTKVDYKNLYIQNISNAPQLVVLPQAGCFFEFRFNDMNTSIALDGKIPNDMQRSLSESLLECYHSSLYPALGDTTLKERAIECNGKWF